ncbi:inositol monophosphatase family protein [Pseudotabrizicola formosa]|uniref:inositol monophosphatase family protein n=1 Tax=Pseudotabrizicola formosa TaxID=2030009 RepID=UPI000CD27FDC|nr:inositol monophosphatase family protein [Pseudotabrizicola formosa]
MFDVLTPLAHAAGDLALSHFGTLSQAAISAKGPLDLVTEADRAVEALIIKGLRAAFPQDGILGEEGGRTAGTSDRVWVIDPIDGTINFVRGGTQWAVSIGLWQAGVPVAGIIHAPALGLTLAGGAGHPPRLNGRILPPLTPYLPDRAVVGVALGRAMPVADRIGILRYLTEDAGVLFRCCNASTIALLDLATGEVDAHVGCGESAWDVMAAWPILVALGATSTLDWQQTPLDAKLRYVIGKPALVEAIASLGRAAA